MGAQNESEKAQEASWRKGPSAEMLSMRHYPGKEGLEEPAREEKEHMPRPWGGQEQSGYPEGRGRCGV